MTEEFYIPKEWRKQDTKNKQGSDGEFSVKENEYASGILRLQCESSYRQYKQYIENGVSREMARMVLPQNLYTEIYSNWDLNNLTHFFTLRLDIHAQWEIRQYAKAMYDIAKKLYPWTIAAYDRYKWNLVDLDENK